MTNPKDPKHRRPQKGMVLKCDKPRYDGGVEINLERYLGRPLQPSPSALRKKMREQSANTMKEAVDKLKEAQGIDDAAPKASAVKAPEEKADKPKVSNRRQATKLDPKAAKQPPPAKDEAESAKEETSPEKKPGLLAKIHLAWQCLIDFAMLFTLGQLALVLVLRYKQARPFYQLGAKYIASNLLKHSFGK